MCIFAIAPKPCGSADDQAKYLSRDEILEGHFVGGRKWKPTACQKHQIARNSWLATNRLGQINE
jgi:hypothetical protein